MFRPISYSSSLYFTPSTLWAHVNRPRRDEEINSTHLKFVNAQGQLEGIRTLKEVLGTIDREKYWLVEVAPNEVPPVCKLIEKKVEYEKQKASQQKSKYVAKGLSKEIRFTWHISENDLIRKLEKAKEFLRKGHFVRVAVLPRRNKRHSPQDEERIKTLIIESLSADAKEIRPPEFNKGQLTIEIVGKLMSDTPAKK